MSDPPRSESVVLRPVRSGDVPAVVALVRTVLEEFGLTFGEGSPTDDELFALPDSYRVRGGAFWIAEDAKGALLGTCGIVPVGPSDHELRKMYLDRAARGLGLGARLLALALEHARSSGAARVVLDTTEAMRDAIAFYERNGFVRDDTQIRGCRCSRGYVRALEPK